MVSTQTASGPIASRWIPQSGAMVDGALITGGALLTAVAAQISIPFEPVPFTLQTLAVALCGLTLGARRGFASQALYLAAGCAGLPIFANLRGGLSVLLGPTGGYLIGFLAVAALLGWVADRGGSHKLGPMVLAMLTANVVLFALGGLWLSFFVGGPQALASGVIPFLIPEAIKGLIVAGLLPAAWQFLPKVR